MSNCINEHTFLCSQQKMRLGMIGTDPFSTPALIAPIGVELVVNLHMNLKPGETPSSISDQSDPHALELNLTAGRPFELLELLRFRHGRCEPEPNKGQSGTPAND